MSLNAKISEQRSQPRHKIKLRVLLVSGRRMHHTYTANISMGGVLLDELPERDFSYPVLQLLVHDKESSLQILFKVEFVGRSQNRLRFIDIKKDQIGMLKTWIDEHKAELRAQSGISQ